jgi:hypothetical protein
MDELKLADFIDTREELPPIWVAYPGSDTFQILVRPLASRHQDMIQEATEPRWETGLMRKKMVLNQDKYLELFAAHTIADWRGLKPIDLNRLIPLADPKKIRRQTGEVACDAASKLLMLRHSAGFSAWMNRVVFDIELYNNERAEGIKKK